ncbi:protein transport protein S31 [Spiromyces aspiralis]|uniref:Protein transport protein S31 n=1 Tax=Spiromyces aspiralis TaxID=68401 RepID=A0ACC1HWJ0_9FUNG|nr:protein transport protein S31 [Spiromyces aspiralis]
MDASFSSNSELELFEVPFRSNTAEPMLRSVGKLQSKSRFYRLAWSQSIKDRAYGLIAGGLENGQVEIWDPQAIIDNSGAQATVFSSIAHHGSVCGVEFNPIQASLLATSAENGEVLVWDANNDFKSYTPGARSQRLEKVTDLAWNNQVQHILATASNTGSSVVWDLRNRREIIALNYSGGAGVNAMGLGPMGGMMMNSGRLGISAIAWNPDNATQLVTASEDDNNPVIMLWDLRNANAPSAVLQGHTRGILSLSWCKKDSGLLLSSGKDNRTICWNPFTQDIVGELPAGNNWVFDVQWCQHNPNVISTASFDGRVGVYSIESSNRQGQARAQIVDDPFAPNALATQGESLYLKRAPKWLARSCSATFGFGGRMVYFTESSSAAQNGSDRCSSIFISTAITEPQLSDQARQLDSQLENDQGAEVCDARIKQLGESEASQSWKVLRLLFESDAREKMIDLLGFDRERIHGQLSALVAQFNQMAKVKDADLDGLSQASGTPDVRKDSARAEDGQEDSPFGDADAKGDDFFSQELSSVPNPDLATAAVTTDTLLNGEAPLRPLFTKPFSIGATSIGDNVDKAITGAIVMGEIEAAVDLCIENERFADALIMAAIGTPELLQRAQRAYFKARGGDLPYARIMHGIIANDLSDVVKNADVSEWKQIMALLCTYSQGEQFTNLCEVLGSRLEAAALESRQVGELDKELLRSAVLCYLASGHLEKVVHIWIAQEREEARTADANSQALISKRIQALHNLVEKISVFRKAVGYIDPHTSAETQQNGIPQSYPLAPLYDHYAEYAEFLTSQGLFDVAVHYLERTPDNYKRLNAVGEDELAILKHRLACRGVYHSAMSLTMPWAERYVGPEVTQQPPQQQQQQQQQQQHQEYQAGYLPGNAVYPQPQPLPQSYQQSAMGGGYGAQPGLSYTGAYPSSIYHQPQTSAPPVSMMPNSQYGYMQTSYAGSGIMPSAPATSMVPPPPVPVNPSSVPTGMTPPPRAESAWNDPPILPKKSRMPSKPKVSVQPITSPFAQASSTPPPPPAMATAQGQSRVPPPPPPSRGMQQQQQQPPPPPPPTSQQARGVALPPKPTVPPPRPGSVRPGVVSPIYNGAAQSSQPLMPMAPGIVPPQHYSAPAPPAYQPLPEPQFQQQLQQQQQQQYSTPMSTEMPSVTRGRIVSPPPSHQRRTPAPARSMTPQTRLKYPPGDRSHIPAAWMDVYKHLNASAEAVYGHASPAQARVVEDTKKRLNSLFDRMNNEMITDPDTIIPKFGELVGALSQRNYQAALEMVTDAMKLTGDLTKELIGVKRLVTLLRDMSL